jgi:hypothetical protein
MLHYNTRQYCVKRHRGESVVPGDKYRAMALELLARAETESDPQIRAEFENLAASYLRLAEQAEVNSRLDVTYEPPPPKIDDPDLKQ